LKIAISRSAMIAHNARFLPKFVTAGVFLFRLEAL
jgi:hypothetical protein